MYIATTYSYSCYSYNHSYTPCLPQPQGLRLLRLRKPLPPARGAATGLANAGRAGAVAGVG